MKETGKTKIMEYLIPIIVYSISISIGLSLGLLEKETVVIEAPQPQIQDKQPDHKELNQENVLYWLNYFEVKHPEIVLAQSIQECGWKYDSYRAMELNNIFGFETSTGALSFGHWIGSVVYYKKWQDTYYTGGDYFKFLQEYGYAVDTLYTAKIKQIVNLIEIE